jgi:DHA2 family multidrug resistance protein
MDFAASGGSPREVNPWIVAISVMFGTFMVVLDTTVVNVSLPYIAGSLSASIEESTWALTSYLAANAIVLPITGWLASYVGRKRLLELAVLGFAGASFVCGLSPSLEVLILFRVIQGATGGFMQPLSQAVMLEAFPSRERGKAMAFWGVGVVLAPILGPVLGGWLTDTYSWRWVFFINIPVGVVAFIMTRLFIFDPPYLRRPTTRIDYAGIGLLAVGIGALQVGLDKGQEKDWFSSTLITGLLVTAGLALIVLLIRELTIPHPVVDLRVFKKRTYAAGVVLFTLMGFVLYGSLVLIPVLLQTLLGYPPLQAGITMSPRGVGTLMAMVMVGIIVMRVDPRKILGAGFLISALTLYWLARLDLNAGFWDFFWPQIVQGIGFGMLFVPLTTVTMDPIPKEEMGNATSLFNLMRNIGGSVGIAVVETMLERSRQTHINILGVHVNPYSTAARQMFEALRDAFIALGSDAVTATGRAYAALFGMVEKQASMMSFIDVYRLLGLIFLVSMPLIFLMRRPRHKPGEAGAPAAE